jgi:hypothetical protein
MLIFQTQAFQCANFANLFFLSPTLKSLRVIKENKSLGFCTHKFNYTRCKLLLAISMLMRNVYLIISVISCYLSMFKRNVLQNPFQCF